LFGNKNAWLVTGETKVQQTEVPTKLCSNHAHGEDIDVTIDSARQKLDAVHRSQILILQFPSTPINTFKDGSKKCLTLSKKDMHAWVSFVRKFMNEYTNLRVIENRENSNNLKVINPGYTLSSQKVV
ncbi:hypothetical protein CUMW_043730, partial [Citrus unshiu]